jgi:hypothetical protein
MIMYSCSKPKPITVYISDKVWFAKFKDTHGASDPMKQISSSKGEFVVKRFDKRFEVNYSGKVFDLTIDSFKNYTSSTRFFLKDKQDKLFQVAIYADSLQLRQKKARIEFTSWSKPYYSKFMDWNPIFIYSIDVSKQ